MSFRVNYVVNADLTIGTVSHECIKTALHRSLFLSPSKKFAILDNKASLPMLSVSSF